MRRKSDGPVRALLLDFDGVICQTETYKLDRMMEYFGELGLRAGSREIYRLAGGVIGEKEAILDRIFGGQERYRQVRDQVLGYRPPMPAYGAVMTPGIAGTLEAVKGRGIPTAAAANSCFLYTSDAADDLLCGDLGGRRDVRKKYGAHC